MKNLVFILLFLAILSCQSNKKKDIKSTKKITVIAHRGASGYLPEHTLASKVMAYAMQADYIEQDVVLSKDDVPIVIHDILLDDVTNVLEKYPNRKREDGRYYVIDFTFEEIKTLVVTERFDSETGLQIYPNRFPKGTSSFRLHSLQDEIELIQGLNKSTGKNIGIYPEIKKPEFHHENGKDISKIVLNILSDYGYKTKNDKCIVQSFDAVELERIRKELKSQLFLVQLMEFSEQKNLLEFYASYADGIGPWYKHLISSKTADGFSFTPLIKEAHKLDLVVHPYTFREDQLDEFDSFEQMIDVIIHQAGADGGFTDFPNRMREILQAKL
ncbi:glycerophosphodiester phosphodiesterase [Flavobacteriaceae bacterium]|nr:glycerophosphodiester phosphodiesterase [Flavobacteriaceae bacterium]MDA9327809.1 glycerophosphodiester phosphodiesterase [Flavobacteriaceae bacterium]